ncbi:PEP/pyruvate-binding domain-containing protein [Plebeiibacterium sediminum]|uniref:Phosphoenolpyruvate synthase n=1 Tax=Plebeiibacterium sediminum TaxID=2992112 RepID=A0AAE3SG69_9BACT|nr:PEP/pyruvate-binding domain-containing protein [Plebeiobacterium sediminum]MCW3788190.1 hypothetical protein [Plebeiobacterium sediminum]
MKVLRHLLPIIIFLGIPLATMSQSNEEIAIKIKEFKSDIKGPYKDIRWFCPDGSVVPPQQRCPDKGGVQRARYKDYIVELQKNQHLYLGQILSTTNNEEFWDAGYENSRLKQYQLEKYLRSIDNGWINRKAQFYRGAYQAEDEDNWGIDFFKYVLSDDENLKQHYFLIRQAIKDIPHRIDDNLSQNIRLISKEISDTVASFLNIRVKIHGQPDESDINEVRNYLLKNKSQLSPEIIAKLEKLIKSMDQLYHQDHVGVVKMLSGKIASSELKVSIGTYNTELQKSKSSDEKFRVATQMLVFVRNQINTKIKANDRLLLLDISLKLEEILRNESPKIVCKTTGEQVQIIELFFDAVYGCGYIEEWEWNTIKKDMITISNESVTVNELNKFYRSSLSVIEWCSSQYSSSYDATIERFTTFEPLVNGFIDEKIRNSCLLMMGQQIEPLNKLVADKLGNSNIILNTTNGSQARGLNPGYAKGKLLIISNNEELKDVNSNCIYVFNRPPADLKPVAGIMTITEGNMVSHVQLLARNLGIPNAVITPSLLNELKSFNAQEVFYAVKKDGSIIMKLQSEMSSQEQLLFTKTTKQVKQEKVRVPLDKMKLDQTSILKMKDLNATHSGIYCGPKAANLAQLKLLFPDNVVNGLVIPFGIFKNHLNQTMPGKQISYWQYLNQIFKQAESMKNNNQSDSDIEIYIMKGLDEIRNAIKNITFLPSFIKDLQQNFTQVFGQNIGSIPVFLRSDTNMEDLKEFTGAGLNLTLFNVLDEQSILQGIRDVWASPYTERSYKWRQKFLLNPENVFPSILIIPSVNADCSGVIITKNVINGSSDGMTLAFNKGVGGAVEGQLSETWVVSNGNNQLVSVAREPEKTTLPKTGGVEKKQVAFNQRVLSDADLNQLKKIVDSAIIKLRASAGIEKNVPFDIELGIKDGKIWLFQVRPFVENKNAFATEYLSGKQTPVGTALIKLTDSIKNK